MIFCVNDITQRTVPCARTSVLGDAYRTTQVETEKIADITYKYSYDKEGNITGITKNSGAYRSYEYDGKNQLTKEVNNTTGITTNFTYDAIGNITKKVQSGAVNKTIDYHYGDDDKNGWSKLLIGVDFNHSGTCEAGETISYDAIGNPTSYLGATLSWYGRQLKSYEKGSTSISYTYDADGLRGTKTVNGTKTTYHYVGGQLRYEARGAQKFYYFYDAGGNLSAIRYCDANGNASIYYAVTNIQGDVVRFYNSAGTIVASYQYDAFGNCTITRDDAGIAALNPIRYRGYYYDSETGLYYLQSRYYNPQVGRFLNSDNVTDSNAGVLGFNTFLYCGNNPVNACDPTGHGLMENIGKWVWQNIKTTVKLFTLPFRHVEGSVGLGMGLGGSFGIKATDDILGATLKYSSTKIFEYSSNEANYYSKTGLEKGISIMGIIDTNSFTGVSHMLNDEKCTCTYGDFYNLRKCPANMPCNEVSTDYGISGSLYLGFGGEFSIGVNVESMLEEKGNIRNEYYEFRDSIKIF